jgi:hypothetical protein
LSDGAGGIQSCTTFTYDCSDSIILTIDSSFIKVNTLTAGPLTGTTVIQTFGESFGCSAIYEYCITESGGAKRMGQIMATWDGSGVVFTDNSTPDLNSSTADFIWKVQKIGTSVELVANVLSGTWDALVAIRIIF